MMVYATNSVANDENHPITMVILINEEVAHHSIPMQGRHIDDDNIYFYKGKTFKDNEN